MLLSRLFLHRTALNTSPRSWYHRFETLLFINLQLLRWSYFFINLLPPKKLIIKENFDRTSHKHTITLNWMNQMPDLCNLTNLFAVVVFAPQLSLENNYGGYCLVIWPSFITIHETVRKKIWNILGTLQYWA